MAVTVRRRGVRMANGDLDLGHRDPGIEHIRDGFMPDVVNPAVFDACGLTGPLPRGPDRSVRHPIGLCKDIGPHHFGEGSPGPNSVQEGEEGIGDVDHVRDLLVFGGLGKGDGPLLEIHLAPFQIEDPAAPLAGVIEGVEDICNVGGLFPKENHLPDRLQLLIGDIPLPVRLMKPFYAAAWVFFHHTPADPFPEGVAD